MISTFWKIAKTQPKQLLKLLSQLAEPVCFFDEQGSILHASRQFLKLTCPPAGAIDFFAYFSSETMLPASLQRYWRRALQGEIVSFLSTARDGKRSIECSLQFEPDSKLMSLRATKLDWTPQSQQIADYERLVLTLFNQTGLAAALFSLEGDLIQGNDQLRELLGIRANEAIEIEQFLHSEAELLGLEARQQLVSRDTEVYSSEQQFIDREGEVVWVNLTVSLVSLSTDAKKQQKCFSVLFEDITEDKKLYSALIRTEEKWKTFVANSLSLFIQTSSSGQIIYISPAVERILGYQEEELLDSYLSQLVHPNDLTEFEMALQIWSSQTPLAQIGIECRCRAKSGLWVCLYLQGQRFPLSLEMDGLIIDGYDITDRKFLEAELKASQEKLNALVFTLPGAVFQCDSTYSMRYISDEIQSITGYPAVHFVGHRAQPYLTIVHSEDLELLKRSMNRPESGNRASSIEYRIIHADGEIRWVAEHRHRTSASGKLSWFDGVLVEISERKRTEDRCRSETLNRTLFRVLPKR